MLTALGVALALGGAVTAFGALTRLRAESCPSCDAVGSMAVVRLDVEECPGRNPVATRTRRCLACGCTLIDHDRAAGRPRPAGLAALADLAR